MTVSTTETFRLTVEQTLSLAKGQAGRRQIRSLAGRDNWLRCGRFDAFIWGEYHTPKHAPLHVACNIDSLMAYCTCTGRQRPCNHVSGLYLRWLEQPETFLEDAPGWHASLMTHPSSGDAASPESDDWPAVQRGLEELELWLHDLMRAGMAGLPNLPKDAWRRVSSRLADAHLDELARTINTLTGLPGTTSDWPQQLLVEFGKLHLLIQASGQRSTLSPSQWGDLRLAAGWLDDAFLAEGQTLHDRWHVVAAAWTQDGPLSLRRTWLWSEQENRVAELAQSSTLAQGAPTSAGEALLPTGVAVTAPLRFYPATTPLRGKLDTLRVFSQPDGRPTGYASFDEALASYHSSLIRNPWLKAFPILIGGAYARRVEDRWQILDRFGARLPLAKDFSRGWHLHALSLEPSAAIFGLWDGDVLHPLSLWSDQRWLILDSLRGIA